MAKALLILLALLAGCGDGAAPPEVGSPPQASVTLNWTVPTQNTDGTPLNDLAAYQINFGPSPTAMQSVITVPANQTSLTVTNLAVGMTVFLTVTTVNSQGQTSVAAGPVSGVAK